MLAIFHLLDFIYFMLKLESQQGASSDLACLGSEVKQGQSSLFFRNPSQKMHARSRPWRTIYVRLPKKPCMEMWIFSQCIPWHSVQRPAFSPPKFCFIDLWLKDICRICVGCIWSVGQVGRKFLQIHLFIHFFFSIFHLRLQAGGKAATYLN